MCRALKFGNKTKEKGNVVKVRNRRTNAVSEVTWVGHAKSEYLSWWEEHGKFDTVDITPDTFNEGGVHFKVQDGACLKGIILGRDVEAKDGIVGRKGEMLLVTRPARTTTEKTTAARWPMVYSEGDMEHKLFENMDIIEN